MAAPSSTSSSSPRGFLRRAAAFLAPLVLGLGALDAWMGARWPDPIHEKYVRLFDEAIDDQHLIVGSSVPLSGIPPRTLDATGLAFYNHALHGAGPTFLRHWYALFRRHHPAPRHMVYAIEWHQLRMLPSFTRPLDHDLAHYPPAEAWAAYRAGKVEPSHYLLVRRPLLARREHLQHLLFRQQTSLIEELGRSERGWLPLNLDPPFNGLEDPEQPSFFRSFEAVHVKPETVADLDAFLATLRADGVRVVLVQAPQHTFIQAHPVERGIVERAARKHGADYLDYAVGDAFCRSLDNFVDYIHLSEAGSLRFGARLAADLRRLGVSAGAPSR